MNSPSNKPSITASPFSPDWTDRLGATVSSLCAVHCAVCALLPAAFGVLGLGFLLGHEAEWALTLTAIAFGSGALVMGWRQHRSIFVATCLALGITGLLLSRGLEMSSGHHEEHGQEHHAKQGHEPDHQAAVVHEPEHAAETHGDTHGDGHDGDGHDGDGHDGDGHDGDGHGLGAGIGVLAGVILFFGHLFNLRALRRCREDCCE